MKELANEVVNTEHAEIQFKSLHPARKTLIFVFCFFSYYFLLHLVVVGNLGFHDLTSALILLAAAGVSAHFTSNLASLDHTKVRLDNDHIDILSESNFSGSCRSCVIPVSDIKGYESVDIPFYKQIVIYRVSGPPFTITLSGNKVLELNSFFNSFTRRIDKANRLSDQTFFTAFSQVGRILLVTVILQLLVLGAFELHSLQRYEHPLVINSTVFWKFVLVHIPILYLFKRLYLKQDLRIKGIHTNYVIIGINFILLCAISGLVERACYQMVKLNKPEEIFNHRKDKNFVISNVRVDTSIIGYHYTITSRGRRSPSNDLEHYLATPVNSFQKDWYRLWIAQNYERKIRKSGSAETNETIRQEFKNENILEFKTQLTSNPRFYEVVYSDFNQSFREKQYFSSALSTYKSVIPLIIMKAHFERFDEYKKTYTTKSGSLAY